MRRILVVEDNENLGFGLRTTLQLEGHQVVLATDGESGLRLARENRPELIILDLMLPGMDGYQMLKTIRDEGNDVPVIILTARGEEADKVLGFRLGADDYVTKPFGVLELLARMRALLRRAGRTDDSDRDTTVVRFGDIEIDLAARTVRRAGRPVSLSPRAYSLLVALLRHNGAVVSRLELLQEVWGHRAAVVTRTVDIHVAELRRQLEHDPQSPQFILTVRKAGYRIDRRGAGGI